MTTDTDKTVLEVMLLRWGEGPTGRTVTFLLPEDGGPHPFKFLKSGPNHGQRMYLSVALIYDDESTRALKKDHTLSQECAMCCDDDIFWQFLGEKYQHIDLPPQREDDTKKMVYEICGVDSRKLFDTDKHAGQRWRELKKAFDAWMAGAG